MEKVINDIIAERQHQIEKGYDAAHDDQHDGGEIALAAACYAIGYDRAGFWPFDESMKSKDRRDELVTAAAMIVAEIERFDRQSLSLDVGARVQDKDGFTGTISARGGDELEVTWDISGCTSDVTGDKIQAMDDGQDDPEKQSAIHQKIFGDDG